MGKNVRALALNSQAKWVPKWADAHRIMEGYIKIVKV